MWVKVNVTVTVETASPVMVTCTEDPTGAYTALLDISEVEANPMSVTVEQNGNTKSLSPSPANDQNGPASAPTATPPSAAVSAISYDLVIACSEAGEVVSITGKGLDPDPQTHTCAGSGTENFSLDIVRGENFPTQNNLSLSSTDQYGNPAGGTTTVDVPIDTLAIQPTVSIDSLPDVDASNAQSFTFEGSCSQEGQPVMVSAGALSPQTDPDCTGGLWSVSFDVTSLNGASIAITADHSSSKDIDATQASGSVTNTFICPTNFVAVPSLQDYTTNSFCVMKYEAKNAGAATTGDATDDTPVSQAASIPWFLNHSDSITKCTDLGVGYDLITNDEWQSIARNIENVASNWKNATVGDAGGLSVGHSDDAPSNTLAANSDDNNACHETGQTCNSSTWNGQRRTHTLSNGEVVWDMAGNLDEWVKDRDMTNFALTSNMSQVTDITHPNSKSLSGGTTTTKRTIKGHFGPSGNYTNLNSDPFGGLGFGILNGDNLTAGLIRGGLFSGLGGVFTVSPYTLANASGIRCVYHP